MTIQSVYERFQVMPNLQLHQLRVAGVAAVFLEKSGLKLETKAVITACLLHDMANIIKFELERFPQFLEPEGLAHWQQVQAETIATFGLDEHQASLAMAKAIGASERVLELIKAVSFHLTEANLKSGDLNKMLCQYADNRVTPFGVVSLEDRITDLRNRYQHRYPSPADEQRRQRFAEFARQTEQCLFAEAAIKPSEITDASVAPHLESLATFSLET